MSLRGNALHELVAEQARRTPECPALAFEGERLTYRELDRRTDALAFRLQELGVGPDVVVGLYLDRSSGFVLGALGILKAGGAYLPLDPAFPRSRVEHLIADARVSLLLTEARLASGLPTGPARVLCLEEADSGALRPKGATPRAGTAGPESLAYVIYTSGSTGQPKGVCIEHRAIVSYVRSIAQRLGLEPGMNHAMVSTVAADLGHTVLFPALVTGGCLHLISPERAESQALLSEYFESEGIDVLKIVPSHLAALQTGRHPERVMPRRRLILGGEASRLDFVARLRELAPACRIFNHYGPTETTVGVLTYEVGDSLPATRSGTLPLGKPLPDVRVHVLDEAGEPVAEGATGELFVGGATVARGYLGRPELTAERFVKDRFSPRPHDRMYRTGDLVRRLPGGDLEFCGRGDDQVKIHGYRVELGEIETALRAHPGVRDAVVLAPEDEAGERRLVGAVVPRRPEQPLFSSGAVHVLPDGCPVAHLNRNETEYIYAEVFVRQAYLRHGIVIRPGDCVIDAGANIGLFTVFASRLAGDLRVIALEPNPAAFACLAANAAAHGARVTCLPCGLSDRDGTASMTVFEGLSLLSGFHADPAREREVVTRFVRNTEDQGGAAPSRELDDVIDVRMSARTVTARLRRLSRVIAEHALERVDLLKINVEKSELEVLLGIEDADWPKIRQLVIEADLDENRDQVRRLLESHGYDVVTEQDATLRETELCYLYAVRRSEPGRRLVRERSAGEHIVALPPADAGLLTPAGLRRHLKERLPRYMVPSSFALLEKLPLGPNGKVDRQALARLDYESGPRAAEGEHPRDDLERGLTAIWKDLLKVEQVGIQDDFFDLGGQSLLAIKAVSRIRDAFGVELPTHALFETPTIAGLAAVLRGPEPSSGSAEPTPSSGSAEPIPARRQSGPVPLAFAQEPIWFLQRLAPDAPAYNVLDVVGVKGPYDRDAMHRAVQELVLRHEALRTAISDEHGRPLQDVRPRVELIVAERDLGALPEGEREGAWARVVQEEGRRPFDLSVAPLLRATMVHLSPVEHRLLLVVHHIVVDEWSMEIIQEELKELYAAHAQGRPPRLPELPIQYADFARWQREWLEEGALERQMTYWEEELAGASPVLALATDKPRPAVQSFRGATESFRISAEVLGRARALARGEQATLFMLLQAAFLAVLYRTTGQDDILVGTPITGRTRSETERLVGCFLNTVVMRGRFREGLTGRELLHQVRERALGAYAHPDLPFERLVAALAPERDASRTPLFQVMFIMHDAQGVSQVSRVSGNRELGNGTSKLDLTLLVAEEGDRLEGMFEYDADLFEPATVRRLCGHYETLLEGLVDAPDTGVAALPLLTADEDDEQRRWNATEAPVPEGSVDALIAAQALRTPDRVALRHEGAALTYRELESRAEALADRIRARDVGPGVLVGIVMERSIDMVLALLATWKAGAAYVPLDPGFPAERLSFMVEDSGAALLLTHAAAASALPSRTVPALRVDGDEPAPAPRGAPSPRAKADDLAYVIYTSGSTGRPKGVAVTHRSLANLLASMGRAPGLAASDVLLSVTTLSFDIAALELFLPLVTGAAVDLASRDEARDGPRLLSRIASSGATVMQATPATWRLLLESGWAGTPGLKVLCGGEALSPDLADALCARAAEVWNVYGPTETTVWSSAWRVKAGQPVSIGRPIANTRMWVLDPRLRPLPVGVPGELAIGGAGVARGYWKRPELTAERFVKDPFSADPDARLYRTGDLARWRSDGTLECLGRMDQQVKVRGVRIEPGEIEARLRELPQVGDAVVLAHDAPDGEKQLVAYVACAKGEGPAAVSAGVLREHLAASLPAAMIPSSFVLVESLPRTPNGKVDRKALGTLAPAAGPSADATSGPRTRTEEIVASIWADLLGAPPSGVHESFFAVGGHSLSAVRVVARIRASFGVDVGLRGLFREPTVAGLAKAVDELVTRDTRRPDAAAEAGGASR